MPCKRKLDDWYMWFKKSLGRAKVKEYKDALTVIEGKPEFGEEIVQQKLES